MACNVVALVRKRRETNKHIQVRRRCRLIENRELAEIVGAELNYRCKKTTLKTIGTDHLSDVINHGTLFEDGSCKMGTHTLKMAQFQVKSRAL